MANFSQYAPIFSLYWLHLESHWDPMVEGYIGITRTEVKQRFSSHRSGWTTPSLASAFEADLTAVRCTVLYDELPEVAARALEQVYRPINNIGWNRDPGGRGIRNRKQIWWVTPNGVRLYKDTPRPVDKPVKKKAKA
ncbi:hypothetical protein TRM7557_02230 [Tritonibacter multivorans]|uniref:GIY-YIG domain-containing protein n=1 Tax=Tritonibacter multivorans TaxID=928856 RepID=A0A0P1GCS4_9RHOB|nr:hypothetical protein TRM7557_02230 [Tritonibacter multivorans]SFD24088.1 hypothetical protein SAMN04488049_109141 [Tritonibacter multivorans]